MLKSAVVHAPADPTLRGIAEIRQFFRTNETPIYFISPTAFNLLGIDRWVRNFFYVTFFDSFEGGHPRVVVPTDRTHREFTSIEDVCNHLLRDPEILAWMAARGPGGKAAFVMFDGETEALAAKAGLQVIHPPAELRSRLDSKLVTTRLAEEAGLPSVPNTMAWASTYQELQTLADAASLGDDLVVQTAYGDSGKTTFFIRGQRDWDRHAEKLVGGELKIMKRINNFEVCLEACLTRCGTVVGPFMTSMIGCPELTPYQGGWCGNDIYHDALPKVHRARARDLTEKLGNRLSQEGYRGFFEVDFLVDKDSGELYLGELNPRLSGISSMTNVTAGAYADMPLFLFHLLEYMDVPYEIDVADINRRWAQSAGDDVWSQIIIKETNPEIELLTAAPKTGVWRLDERGRISFGRWANDWHSLIDEGEAFYLSIATRGEYRYKGADLGILVARGRMQNDDGELTERCHEWIDALKAQFAGTPVAPGEPSAPVRLVALKQPG
ncbi:biotin carboxylase [Solirubrobacter soli]|uniref:biotin carboxylase n=1 Tax=Solirubrobacter soli TaxID=363832 RepID=UPI00041289C0|nr:biotin carboxylase [Solirubrobacter soli]